MLIYQRVATTRIILFFPVDFKGLVPEAHPLRSGEDACSEY